jgi:hypothetical protein
MRQDYTNRLKQPGISGADKFVAQKALAYLTSLRVSRATKDSVSFTQTVGATKKLVFGFRGTAAFADLVPDALLALNAGSVQRLEQAKTFVAQERQRNPDVKQKDMDFMGHSLGGFIAEGVRSFYPGSRAIVVSPGTVRLGNADGVNAFQRYDPAAEAKALGSMAWLADRIVRIRHQGDPVAGVENNGPSRNLVVARRADGMIDPLNNHRLGAIDGECCTSDLLHF